MTPSVDRDDLQLRGWRILGSATEDDSDGRSLIGRSSRKVHDELCALLARDEPPACVCVEGASGVGKTRCCKAALHTLGLLEDMQLWDSRECATSNVNSTQICRGSSRRKGKAKSNRGPCLLPSIGIDPFFRKEEASDVSCTGTGGSAAKPHVVLVDNIHDFLLDDKGAFAAMLRTVRSAQASNRLEGARKTCVLLTVDKSRLDVRLYHQLERCCGDGAHVLTVFPAEASEVCRYLKGVLGIEDDGRASKLEACAACAHTEGGGLRETLLRFMRDAEEEEPCVPEEQQRPDRPELPPADARQRVCATRACFGFFKGMRLVSIANGEPQTLWDDIVDALQTQLNICEGLLQPHKHNARTRPDARPASGRS